MSDSTSISGDRPSAIALAAAEIVKGQQAKKLMNEDEITRLLAKVLDTYAEHLPRYDGGGVKPNK